MITVVGSLNLDMVVRVDRMPDPGETLLARGYAEHHGGKGANQAVAAVRAGGRVAMIGRIGRDEAGSRLRDGLASDDIDVAEVRTVEAPTGRALIEVDAAGQNRIVVVPGANAAWTADDLPGEALIRSDVIVLQREVPDDVVAAAIRRGAAAGRRTVLNLAPAGAMPDDVLAACSVLVVNESEAAFLDGCAADDVAADPLGAARRLASRALGDVVVTLGADGAVHAGAGGEGRIEGFPVHAVDTTAAGDAFVGALATRLDEGAVMGEAVRFGCAAGAEAVTREGAQPSLPDRAAIEARLGGGAPLSRPA
ncbi:MAG: ribokinase [Trueperaceae bacterium]|nr:ribokinase [Trueperaceae bacterium]